MPATQTNLARPAKAGDNTLFLDTTADLVAGQEITIDTGDRKEIAVVKNVLVSARKRIRRFGEPTPPAPPELGQVELAAPLQKDHAESVDVSSPGTGVRFEPATRFAHESGDALQPFTAEPEGLYATGKPDVGLTYRYALSPTAGSVALVDPATGRSPPPPGPSPWSIPPPASSWTPSCTVRSRATPARTGRLPAPNWRR